MSTPQTGFSVIQVRRATTATWTSTNPILRKGEPGVEFKTNGTYRLKIGDGTTAWNSLEYVTGVGIDELSDVVISNPVQNDQGIIYENGIWKNKTVIAAASVNKVKPSPATDGALWFDPEDGRLYRYYVDTDSTAQWIEIKQAPAQQSNVFTSGVTMQSTLDVSGTTTLGTANITSASLVNPLSITDGGTGATTGSGLVNIVPVTGDITVAGGTLTSISSKGKVDFANATRIQIDNIFSSAYDVYEVYFIPTTTTVTDYYYSRFTTSGTVNSSSNYYSAGIYQQGGTVSNWDTAAAATTYARLGYAYTTNSSYTMMRIINPYSNTLKTEYAFNSAYGQANHTMIYGSCLFDATTRFDGITFGNVTSGSLTGSIQVFGLKK